MTHARLLQALAPLALASAAPAAAQSADAATRAEAQAGDHVAAIRALDDAGPMLNAVIVYDPDPAIDEAMARTTPLAGRTVLVKDNIETREWPTTAGSLALADNDTGRDAPIIARLRKAGGVVLGKTNLSEWANIRSTHSSSGWSAVGGLTRNPHATDRNACGSSSGSAVAVAAGLAWAAIGTETDGSITCPASVNGVVGFKPSVGLVSRTHIVPISSSQDTAGPMATSVYDAALLLNAIAGRDPLDPATSAMKAVTVGDAVSLLAREDALDTDFTEDLAWSSLADTRIGVLRAQVGDDPRVAALFEQALADLKRAGAVLVDIQYEPEDSMGEDEYKVLLFELRETLDAYLAGSPADIPVRSLAEAIAFNREHARAEMRWFGQEIFELAAAATDRAAYDAARANSLRLAGEDGIDRLRAEHEVQFLVAPTAGPAWTTDLVNGDHYNGSIGAGSLAAIAGYPHLTVPMGAVEALPIGLSFIGKKWSDHAVLRAGAAYERARSAAVATPAFVPWQPAAD